MNKQKNILLIFFVIGLFINLFIPYDIFTDFSFVPVIYFSIILIWGSILIVKSDEIRTAKISKLTLFTISTYFASLASFYYLGRTSWGNGEPMLNFLATTLISLIIFVVFLIIMGRKKANAQSPTSGNKFFSNLYLIIIILLSYSIVNFGGVIGLTAIATGNYSVCSVLPTPYDYYGIFQYSKFEARSQGRCLYDVAITRRDIKKCSDAPREDIVKRCEDKINGKISNSYSFWNFVGISNN